MPFRSARSLVALGGGLVAATLFAGALFVAPPAGAVAYPPPAELEATPNPILPGETLSIAFDCETHNIHGASAEVHGAGDGELLTATLAGSGFPLRVEFFVNIPADWEPGLGSVDFTCTFWNGMAPADLTESLPLTIGGPPDYTDETLGAPVIGGAFSDGVVASAYPAATYAVTAGELPAGLTLDAATGAITGTPTVAAPYAFTITATNEFGTDVTSFSGTIASTGTGPVFTDVTAADGVAGAAYADAVAASGDPAPTYAVVEGVLPPGIALDPATGALVGTPTTPGTSTFTVAASNVAGSMTEKVVLAVAAPPAAPVDNDGQLDVSVVDLSPEGSTTLVATGYKPGTEVAFVIYSEPLFLGTTIADENGVATLLATLPSGFPLGEHTVVSLGEDALGGDRVMSQQVTVSTSQEPAGPELPRTGGDTVPVALIGALLLGGGAVLVTRGRRLVRG